MKRKVARTPRAASNANSANPANGAMEPVQVVALTKMYRDLVVPHGNNRSFNYLGQFGWRPAKYKNSGRLRAFRLRDCHAHLSGQCTFAVRWYDHRLSFTTCVVFDIDNKRKDLEDLVERLRSLEDALGAIPFVLFRSSSSGGFHVYVFFTEAVPTDEAREVACLLLKTFGLPLKPGTFEVWPANQPLRLPLGRGSCILDPESLEPLAAHFDRGRRLRRHIPESIELLARMVAKARVPFDDLRQRAGTLPASRGLAAPNIGGVAQGRMQSIHSPHPSPAAPSSFGGGVLKGAAYHADVAASAGGITDYGRRRDQANRRLHYMLFDQRMTRSKILVTFEHWLRTGKHKSHSLQQRREPTIRKMLRDAPGYLDHLERGIKSNRLRQGAASDRGHPGLDASLTCILPIVQHQAKETGLNGRAGWRKFAPQFLSSKDRAIIAKVGDPWLERHLSTLIGLLRFEQRRRGRPIRRMTLCRRILQGIAGGKPPPKASRVAAHGDGTFTPGVAYVVLTKTAERLGFVRFLQWGKKGKHSSIYTVTLP